MTVLRLFSFRIEKTNGDGKPLETVAMDGLSMNRIRHELDLHMQSYMNAGYAWTPENRPDVNNPTRSYSFVPHRAALIVNGEACMGIKITIEPPKLADHRIAPYYARRA